MPINVEAVSMPDYLSWLASTAEQFIENNSFPSNNPPHPSAKLPPIILPTLTFPIHPSPPLPLPFGVRQLGGLGKESKGNPLYPPPSCLLLPQLGGVGGGNLEGMRGGAWILIVVRGERGQHPYPSKLPKGQGRILSPLPPSSPPLPKATWRGKGCCLIFWGKATPLPLWGGEEGGGGQATNNNPFGLLVRRIIGERVNLMKK